MPQQGFKGWKPGGKEIKVDCCRNNPASAPGNKDLKDPDFRQQCPCVFPHKDKSRYVSADSRDAVRRIRVAVLGSSMW
ncbi:hypothetical protein ILYODFUR_015064 [Ilyodon furcidens]|uniref:Uncharacterized protein n=1 Tax=Ilyodon furcidens TaxID=33524 RepID=A0ABV0V3X8_9TELE